ncbi:hypothetical protein BGZ96_011078 [Linnemannia gamsii]|uniref:Uncharacterized protein n=1 Tax=Linnemannia gamsii TaxID=64522 RepID=A0ABQ7JSX4_9FUNG|nr:hypothetical protein BGZ96_011078 [Linnemannia gamsii]
MSYEQRDKLRDANREYVRNNPEAQKLAEQEMNVLIAPEMPETMFKKYGELARKFMCAYWKNSPRYVDVVRVVKFVQSLQQDLEQEKIKDSTSATTTTTTSIQQLGGNVGSAQKSYGLFVDYVRKGQACGPDACEDILELNVANGDTSAFGRHSIDDVSKWGQPHERESGAESRVDRHFKPQIQDRHDKLQIQDRHDKLQIQHRQFKASGQDWV